MPLFQDVSGSPVTCSCQEVLDIFNQGLTGFVTVRESPVACFREAAEKDDSLVIAHAMMVSRSRD